ncbi:MAG: (d)CMP kinase [Butyricicoccus pullicaecorum]|nr:(d)CMP kinase [Butyricicoccus pullicaecorum]
MGNRKPCRSKCCKGGKSVNHTVIAIAIDGPAGAGKSTIARAAAEQLGFIYVDTGALYRTIGLAAYRRGIAGTDTEGIIKMLSQITVDLQYQKGVQSVLLDGEDVSSYIRTPQISVYASQVSAIPEVRAYLLDLQRQMAQKQSVIMDGRDIGTVILPHAQVKIFLTASAQARAERRCAELREKGEQVTIQEVLADIQARDEKDSSRSVAPLRQSEEAVCVDTSALTLEQSISAVLQVIRTVLEEK